MLQNLIELRNTALENYSISESIKDLGLYNKSVNNLQKHITDNNIEYSKSIDILADESDSLSRKISKKTFDLSNVNEYNTDFEID